MGFWDFGVWGLGFGGFGFGVQVLLATIAVAAPLLLVLLLRNLLMLPAFSDKSSIQGCFPLLAALRITMHHEVLYSDLKCQ